MKSLEEIVKTPQTVKRLEVKNIKGVRHVDIYPAEKQPVIIGGKNGQGKSSTIDSIVYALSGKRALPEQPIRDGQNKAFVLVETEDLIIKRTFTASGGGFSISKKEGGKLTAPQSIADALVGRLAFDPLEFSRMSNRAQAELLRELSGLDLSEIDDQIESTYNTRTAQNAECKSLQNQFEQCEFYSQAPESEISATDVLTELKEAKDHNSNISDLDNRINQYKINIETMNAELDLISERMKVLISERKATVSNLSMEQNNLKTLQLEFDAATPISMVQLDQKIETLDKTNNLVRSNVAYRKVQSALRSAEKSAEELSNNIYLLRATRREQIQQAKMPIDGLEIGEDGVVVFNGIPVAQCSTAERLKISASIGFSLNPIFRVLIIREGSALDEDNLNMIVKMAQERNVQPWIECVGTRDRLNDGAIIIEDGSIQEK